ncbi:sulfotransferase [Defluviimonas sp. 20V17]|uniref:Sulfotransferase n=1 Tax=Allgaiera indica TaxID=765699 RepID=A0AAN4UNF5_9RHOB|nr:sulfotransferase domain-containing protein [Allgaiera indica]KDB02994.1 sulfotransferase [Defluviimonas sp. 20V17]GHD98599.1 sulfotransferase [Allgaiera indica]SDW10133.1 Sulfotransferase domain-containing protein [Allgaiera indica]
MTLPDFLIIGAMKCGTSTLQTQLAAQQGIFMCDPKEPNFFSDDAIYAKGLDWYESLFAAAAPGDLKGEASTHYTKLPTYPETLPRLRAVLSGPRLIYVIRNPLVRAVSHYVHEWTQGVITGDLDRAIDRHPELIAYGRYGEQIAPWAEAFGAGNILLLSLEEMQADPQGVLDRTGAFLRHPGPVVWRAETARVNVSAERVRRLPLQGLLIDNPVATALRRALVPKAIRARIRASRQMQDRPVLTPERQRALEQVFAEDRARLVALFPGAPALSAAYPFLTS